MDRTELLQSLVEMQKPILELLDQLHQFDWDSGEPLITLTPQHIILVLKKYVDGQIGSSTVQEWADTIHIRDDIGLDPVHENNLRDVLHELANPFLVQPLTLLSAKRLMAKLGGND